MIKGDNLMNNGGWGLRAMLVMCFILALAIVISATIISQNFGELLPDGNEDINENYNSKAKTYSAYESDIRVAGKKYIFEKYNTVDDIGGIVVTVNKLVSTGYMDEIVDINYNKCSGYLYVSQSGIVYNYDAYIKCGDDYQTPGYNKVLDN